MDSIEAQKLIREAGIEIGLEDTRTPQEIALAFGLIASKSSGVGEPQDKDKASIPGSYFAR